MKKRTINMRSDWKGVVILILSCFTVVSAQKGAITVGFSYGLFTRCGLTIGYFFSDDISFEIHAGGMPHFLTGGISMKYQPLNNNNNFYLISGIACLMAFSHHRDSLSYMRGAESTFIGLNTGCGYEVNIKNNRWKSPFEGGVFLPVWTIQKKFTINSVPGTLLDKEKVRKGWFSTPLPFFAFGLIWYSQTE